VHCAAPAALTNNNVCSGGNFAFACVRDVKLTHRIVESRYRAEEITFIYSRSAAAISEISKVSTL